MTDAKPPAQDDAGTQAAGLSPDDSARLLELFEAAIDLPPDDREARINALCGDRPELAQALRVLIERDARTGPLDRDLADSLQPLLHEALPALERTPERIGAYQILRLLGEGGMGRVYLARRVDSPVEHTVALKLMRPDRVAPGLLARFEAERQHLAALDHPGICRFIDAGALDDGSPYVVMEAVEGEPLLAYAQRRGLDLRARVELLRLLLAAVAHAHDRLRVHRDIKPQNVLVNAEGQPKLLDFGIAKSIEDERASVTRTAERFFTPNASAPEQLLGQASGVACDVYGLGALAYELLSGALPFEFEGLRAAEIERLILQVAPPLMSELSTQPWARELRGDLDAIIATCLRKSPAERYRNVLALDAELQRWLEGRPVAARAPSWAYRARLFARRHRSAVALSAALALAILGSASALAYQALQLREQRNLALIERDRALQVVEILESAFRNADPAQAAGDTVTARQILDAARSSVEALQDDQPELFARLASTLASVELELGRSKEAAQWAERGLARISDSASDQETRQSLMISAAVAHSRNAEGDKAREALALIEASPWGDRADARFAKARVLAATAKHAEAAEILSELKRAPGLDDPRNPLAVRVRHNLVDALQFSGNFEEAARESTSSLEWLRLAHHERHPWVVLSRLQQLTAMRDTGDPGSAAALFPKLISDFAEIYGETSGVTATARGRFSTTLAKAGEYFAAAQQARLARLIHTQLEGADDISTIRAGINEGTYLIETGTPSAIEQAIPLLEEISRKAKSRFSTNAPITLHAHNLYLKSLLASGREHVALDSLSEFGEFGPRAFRIAGLARNREEISLRLAESGACKSYANAPACNQFRAQTNKGSQ